MVSLLPKVKQLLGYFEEENYIFDSLYCIFRNSQISPKLCFMKTMSVTLINNRGYSKNDKTNSIEQAIIIF